jgi:tetratricopeptide (TPR) repeat protein
VIDMRDRARAAGEQGFATFIEIDRLILSARIALADGEADTAVELLREAAALEGSIEKHPVSPGALLPPFEALGNVLFELERFDEALEAYRASDTRWPERFNTLLGAARAADALGDATTAQQFAQRLLDVAGASPRPSRAEALAMATD